jgi:hypothetical protein
LAAQRGEHQQSRSAGQHLLAAKSFRAISTVKGSQFFA